MHRSIWRACSCLLVIERHSAVLWQYNIVINVCFGLFRNNSLLFTTEDACDLYPFESRAQFTLLRVSEVVSWPWFRGIWNAVYRNNIQNDHFASLCVNATHEKVAYTHFRINSLEVNIKIAESRLSSNKLLSRSWNNARKIWTACHLFVRYKGVCKTWIDTTVYYGITEHKRLYFQIFPDNISK